MVSEEEATLDSSNEAEAQNGYNDEQLRVYCVNQACAVTIQLGTQGYAQSKDLLPLARQLYLFMSQSDPLLDQDIVLPDNVVTLDDFRKTTHVQHTD